VKLLGENYEEIILKKMRIWREQWKEKNTTPQDNQRKRM